MRLGVGWGRAPLRKGRRRMATGKGVEVAGAVDSGQCERNHHVGQKVADRGVARWHVERLGLCEPAEGGQAARRARVTAILEYAGNQVGPLIAVQVPKCRLEGGGRDRTTWQRTVVDRNRIGFDQDLTVGISAPVFQDVGDLLEPGGLDALEEDRALLAEGAAVRLALPLAGRDLRVGGLLGCGRRRLRSDETLYFRWRGATWRTHAMCVDVAP